MYRPRGVVFLECNPENMMAESRENGPDIFQISNKFNPSYTDFSMPSLTRLQFGVIAALRSYSFPFLSSILSL